MFTFLEQRILFLHENISYKDLRSPERRCLYKNWTLKGQIFNVAEFNWYDAPGQHLL